MPLVPIEPLFQARRVSFAYPDGNVALHEVTLDILQCEKVAILGANGSGKSTLLKLLNGLLFAQTGELRYRGEIVSETQLRKPAVNARFRGSVALVFQNPDSQLFCPTVSEEIAFGPSQLGHPVRQTEDRVKEMLSLFRLEEVAYRAPHHLSGGEKKRVALAAALALDPDVILLDEPTASLDPRSKWELVEFLRTLHARGKTFVTATHDLEVVASIADRAIVLAENKTVLGNGLLPALLADQPLLSRANLIHIHAHAHQGEVHRHPHAHPVHDGHHEEKLP